MQIGRDAQTRLKQTKRTLNRVRFALEDEQEEFDRVEAYLNDKEKRTWRRMSSARKRQLIDKAKRMTGMSDEIVSDSDTISKNDPQLTAAQEYERVETAQTAAKEEWARKYAQSTDSHENGPQNASNVNAGCAGAAGAGAAKIATRIIRDMANGVSQNNAQNKPENAPQRSSEFNEFTKKTAETAKTAVIIGATVATAGAAAPAGAAASSGGAAASSGAASEKTAKAAAKIAKKAASEARKSMGRLGKGQEAESEKASDAYRASAPKKNPLTASALVIGAIKAVFAAVKALITSVLPAILAAMLPILVSLVVIFAASIFSTIMMWWHSITDVEDVISAEYEEYHDGMFPELGIDTADVTGEMIAEFALTFEDKTILYSWGGVKKEMDPVFEFNVVSGYREDGTPIYKYEAGDFYPRSDLNWGADCSGFAAAVYRCFGFSIKDYAPTSSGWRTIGREVQLYEIQPGDVICQSGHVTIYVGGGQQIQMSNWGDTSAKKNAINPAAIITIRRLVD